VCRDDLLRALNDVSCPEGIQAVAAAPQEKAAEALPGWLRWQGGQSCLSAAPPARARLSCAAEHPDLSRICPCSHMF